MLLRTQSTPLLWLALLGLAAGVAPRSLAQGQSPELAFGSAVDPFERAPTVLQARKLRGLRAEIASLVLSAEPGGEIALEGLAIAIPGAETKTAVRVFLEIDGASLLEHNQDDPARLEVYAYALDSANQVADFFAEVFAVAVKENGEAIWQGGLKFYGALHLAPGDYRLRLLVRNYQSKSAGLRELRLTVPQPTTGPAIIPFFDAPQTRDAWLPVRPWSDPAAQTQTYPFAAAGEVLRPAARPVIVAGRRNELWVYAQGLPGGTLTGTATWGSEKKTPAPSALEVLERHPAPGSTAPDATPAAPVKAELIKIALTPPALAPATYPLEIRLLSSGAAVASAALPVFVLDAGTREHELLWTDLRWMASDANAPTVAETEVKSPRGERKARRRGQRKRVEQLAGEYRGVLETLVGGRSDAARTALLDFEARVLASRERSSLAALLAAELSFAESLAAGDVESLIPVMCLHDELYRVYRQRRMFSLIFHTRALIEQLADLYALHGRSQGSRVVAGRVLASLAGYLQDANLPGGSRRLFERSLEYDPQGRAALLGLAVSFEKYGDYRRARAYLETLVAGHPRFSEGLLHLANNLARTAEIVRARELWNRIIELDGPSWVRTLAYQELARSWLGTGDVTKTIALLERALAEAPEQSSTALLLAYAYDRQQQPKRAFELVAQAAASPEAGGRAESARKLYDSWPTLVLEEERSDFAAAAQQRLPLLRQLLAVESTRPKAQEEVAE